MTLLPQILIVVLGVTAVWLAASKERRPRFWAGVLGLCAQPAWAWTFLQHEQYLMLVLCVLYASGWARCVKNNRSDVTDTFVSVDSAWRKYG